MVIFTEFMAGYKYLNVNVTAAEVNVKQEVGSNLRINLINRYILKNATYKYYGGLFYTVLESV